MRFTPNVDVPDELVTAAAAGTLVLFVGAGVSMNAPSNLPLFDGLADELARLNGQTYDRTEPADAFLGRLVDKDASVREQAKGIIGASTSSPNTNHAAIVRFVQHSPSTRLVTTNFDEHLTSAASLAGIDLGDRFNGPAVPLAREFSGLVHLHGAVSRPANELVLTDGDFGRAYLTDGWARRFVQELFLDRVVLFIGYSHDDTVMKYLARGLPPTTSRFVLTDIAENSKWADLRITPVAYPADNGHAALTEVLEAWADRLAMGQLDFRTGVKDVVAGGVPKKPVDADFIRHAITTPLGVRAFSEDAAGDDWLLWAEKQKTFADIFTSGPLESEPSRILARWFADTYLADESSTELALGTIARLGPIASHELMRATTNAASHLSQSNKPLSIKLSALVSTAFLADSAPQDYAWPDFETLDSGSVMPFLRRAVRPRLTLVEYQQWYHSDGDDERVTVEKKIAWSGSEDDVESMLNTARSDFETLASDVLQTLEQSVRDGYEILELFYPGLNWDSWSYGRSAIEPHEQNDLREFESNLIDGLRDASVLLSATDRTIVPRWLRDRFPLFRRLGIHALAEDAGSDANAKADQLLSHIDFYDHNLKHELFRIFALIGPDIDESHRKRFLDRILRGPSDFDENGGDDDNDGPRLFRRSVFDYLEWLARYVHEWPELTAAIDVILTQEPDMGVRPHPDLSTYTTSGIWGGTLPYGVDEFIDLTRTAGPAGAMKTLLSHNYKDTDSNESHWADALTLLQQVTAKDAGIGAELFSEATGATKSDIENSIFQGWASGDLDDATLSALTSLVERRVDDPALTRAIAEFARSAVQQTVDSRSPEQLERLDRICGQLWDQHITGFEHSHSDDWSYMALNTWPGIVAQYWINRIRLRWRAEDDNWIGFSPVERETLSVMLETTTAAGRGPFAVITADTYFIHAADAGFAVESVFPRFDGLSDDRAAKAWASYLFNPRLNDSMLNDGFWNLLTGGKTLVDGIKNSRIDNQYWRILSLVTMQSTAAAVDRLAFVNHLAGTGGLVDLINAVARTLDQLGPDVVRLAWENWLHDALASRTMLAPGSLSPAEKAAWGDLALRSGELLPESLTLAAGIAGPLGPNTTFRYLTESLVDQNVSLIVDTLRLRTDATTNPDFRVTRELEKVFGKLKDAGADPLALRDLVEAALRSGIYSASSWLGE